MKRAVFLDRDGTINVEKEYLHRYEDWEWVPGSIEAITNLNRNGFLVVVITNQAGIARGYYNEKDLQNLHERVSLDIQAHGGKIDAYYHCPHHPEFGEDCDCRKPKPGMILRARDELNIDMARSYLVGDKAIDIYAAQAANIKPILVQTGYGSKEQSLFQPNEISIRRDLLDAVENVVLQKND